MRQARQSSWCQRLLLEEAYENMDDKNIATAKTTLSNVLLPLTGQ